MVCPRDHAMAPRHAATNNTAHTFSHEGGGESASGLLPQTKEKAFKNTLKNVYFVHMTVYESTTASMYL